MTAAATAAAVAGRNVAATPADPLTADPLTADALAADALAADALGAADRLAEVLAAENAGLSGGDVAAVRSLAGQRRDVCSGYERALRALEAGIGEGALPQPATRRALHRAAERLRPLLDENGRRLAALIAARERVMAVIAEAAQEAQPGVRTYGRSGSAQLLRRTPAVAISVNCAL